MGLLGILKLVGWIGLIVSCVWLAFTPSFEPLIAIVASIMTLGGLYLIKGREKVSGRAVQSQRVGKGSTAIQAGGDVKIATRGSSNDNG